MAEKVAENAAKLVDGTLDRTSLLALAIGQERLRQQDQVPAEAKGPRSANRGSTAKSQSPNAALARVEDTLAVILTKLGTSAPRGLKTKNKRKLPTKRETVIFAAILMELRGMKFCLFLHDHGINPRWSGEAGPNTYQRGYQVGDPWRKKIQDEKTRAKKRMNSYDSSELATAINAHLPSEFNQISPLLNSRNSPNASKTSAR